MGMRYRVRRVLPSRAPVSEKAVTSSDLPFTDSGPNGSHENASPAAFRTASDA